MGAFWRAAGGGVQPPACLLGQHRTTADNRASPTRRFPEPSRLGRGEPTVIVHLRGRERALEPFGLTGRRAEWIALACVRGARHRPLADARPGLSGRGGRCAAVLPARDARGAELPPRRVRPRRSRLRHLDRAPFVAGPAPEAPGGAEGGWVVGRGRRGRVRPEAGLPFLYTRMGAAGWGWWRVYCPSFSSCCLSFWLVRSGERREHDRVARERAFEVPTRRRGVAINGRAADRDSINSHSKLGPR